MHQVIGGGDDCGVVGGDDERGAPAHKLAHDLDQCRGRRGVELGRRFVGEQQGRQTDRACREGHSLLLAARQLRREAVMAVEEADRVEQDRGSATSTPRMRAASSTCSRAEVGDEVVGRILEHDAERAAAQPAPRPGPQPGDIASVDLHQAGRGRCSPASVRSSDDFPDPDGPVITESRPRSNETSTSRSAGTVPDASRYSTSSARQRAATPAEGLAGTRSGTGTEHVQWIVTISRPLRDRSRDPRDHQRSQTEAEHQPRRGS